MRCGLYGKLPAKRDFIAIASPREFLAVWEPWMQGSVAASRETLGANWQPAFLTAPIWRFWLGADLCGATVAGAWMASMDGVGRYFPLTLFSAADRGGAVLPPELDPQEPWFAAVEDFLIASLDKDVVFSELSDGLDAMTPPAAVSVVTAATVADGVVVVPGDDVALAFAEARRSGQAQAYAGSSFWWTSGGEGFPPRAMAAKGMPDPYLFSAMLTGAFPAMASGEGAAA